MSAPDEGLPGGGEAPCARVAAAAPAHARGDALDPALAAHAAGCPGCAATLAGARALGGALAAWAAPAPPDDLVARTLARLAVAPPDAGRADDGVVPGAVVPPLAPAMPALRALPGGARRRTSVELLTSSALPGGQGDPAVPPTRRQLWLRLVSQAVAASLLFAVCTGFVAVFYPAITHAIDHRRVTRCQERLVRLHAALARYRAERPDAPELRGLALVRALVDGGYVNEGDLVCPGPRGRDLGERSYVGHLPAGAALPADRPVFWDRFGNHGEGFNVVHGDGRVELVSVEALPPGWGRAREEAGAGE